MEEAGANCALLPGLGVGRRAQVLTTPVAGLSLIQVLDYWTLRANKAVLTLNTTSSRPLQPCQVPVKNIRL